MRGMFGKAALAAAGGFVFVSAASAGSVTYDFSVLENNSPIDLSGQLSVTVSDQWQRGGIGALGANQVSFLFENVGSLRSSITDVYFDDGTLLGIAQIRDSAGVRFRQGASPSNLPGGNSIGFQTTAGFLADSDPPVQSNGVNATMDGAEWLEIVFDLINGKTYADTVAALSGGQDLRIGLHLQGLADGESETYVTRGPSNIIPLPSTAGLAAAGLLLVGARRRR